MLASIFPSVITAWAHAATSGLGKQAAQDKAVRSDRCQIQRSIQPALKEGQCVLGLVPRDLMPAAPDRQKVQPVILCEVASHLRTRGALCSLQVLNTATAGRLCVHRVKGQGSSACMSSSFKAASNLCLAPKAIAVFGEHSSPFHTCSLRNTTGSPNQKKDFLADAVVTL